MIRFRCPNCRAEMEVDESFGGRGARCPTCGSELRVPRVEQADAAITPMAQPLRPGATVVRIGDELIEVVPPIEPMALVSLALLVAAVAAVVIIGLMRFVTFPWTIGMAIGSALALLGAMTALPAYHSIRRSQGRRRGRSLALLGMIGGSVLFLVCVVGFILGLALVQLHTHSCEENLAKIDSALRLYADRHGGRLPQSLEVLVTEGYLERRGWLTCPAYRVAIGTNTYTRHIGGVPVDLNDSVFPRNLMIVSDGPPYNAHEDGFVRALLLDGTIEKVPHRRWPGYVKEQGRIWSDIRQQLKERSQKDAGAGAEEEGA